MIGNYNPKLFSSTYFKDGNKEMRTEVGQVGEMGWDGITINEHAVDVVTYWSLSEVSVKHVHTNWQKKYVITANRLFS